VRGDEQFLAGYDAHGAEDAVQTEDALDGVVVDLRLAGRDAVGGAGRIRIRSSRLQELQLERDRRRIRVRDPDRGRELRTVRALNLAGGRDDEVRPGKAVGARLLLCGDGENGENEQQQQCTDTIARHRRLLLEIDWPGAIAEARRVPDGAAVLFQCPARDMCAKMAGASGCKWLKRRKKYFCARRK
jgi:hypothetical protein